MYHFSPLAHVTGLVYFVPIAVAFLLLKENKRPAAFLILLPMLLVWGMWRGLAAMILYPQEVIGMLNSVVLALLAGFIVVWLLGERIGHRDRYAVFTLAALIMLGSFALTLIETGISSYAFSISLFGVISVGIILTGFVFAGFRCHRRFGPIRFSLFLGLGLLLGAFAIIGIYIGLMIMLYFSFSLLWEFFVVSLIFASVVWFSTLPFLVLFFTHDFWRQRFTAVMGLGKPQPSVPVPQFDDGNLVSS